MTGLRVAPIVEGHGEVQAVPILLRRVWTELLGQEAYIDVLRPIRQPRDRLVVNKNNALEKAIQLATGKLQAAQPSGLRNQILVLVDADEDLPCVLEPELSRLAKELRPDVGISCVIANVEFETWFAAAAESLHAYLDVPNDSPADPEQQRLGKGWIERHFRRTRYSPTVDQPKLTASMDLELCRERSPSFDKLCREIEKLL